MVFGSIGATVASVLIGLGVFLGGLISSLGSIF